MSARFEVREPGSRSNSRLRIAFYSHDTMGLGHIRRNLLITQSLVNSSLKPQMLLIAGTPEAAAFCIPPRTACLTIPALLKHKNGEYGSRSSELSIEGLIDLRAKTIRFAVEQFQPDVFIVDKVPRGALGELDTTLQHLRRSHVRCVLGLRDILDEPAAVEKEWHKANNYKAIRDYYHAIWIYGDPHVYDAVKEYDFPEDVANKVQYTGYQNQKLRLEFLALPREDVSRIISAGPYVLCLVGGGQDGALLAETFVRCNLPVGMNGVVIAGPHMPWILRQRLHNDAAKNPRICVLDFVNETGPLLANASRLVAMGGYNTMCEVLSFAKPALIVPRVIPRREQLVRAQRMQKMGLIDLLHWEDVTSEAITKWLSAESRKPFVRHGVDLNGLVRLPQLLTLVACDRNSSITERCAKAISER